MVSKERQSPGTEGRTFNPRAVTPQACVLRQKGREWTLTQGCLGANLQLYSL